MLLSDRDILAAQKDGHISLDPWTPEMVQPASIDVRLDRFFRLFNNHAYTYVDPVPKTRGADRAVRRRSGRAVDPASGRVRARLDVGVRQARRDGGGTLGGQKARWAVWASSHIRRTGFIDPGFEGHITLELSNVSTLPVKLWPGMKIGQMCFFQLSSP